MSMLKSYFVIALRKLAREKSYVLLNILSLALGIGGFLLLALYLRGELTYDQHHVAHERIYRLTSWFHPYGSREPDQMATTGAGTGPTLVQDFPQLGQYVRFRPFTQNILSHEQESRTWERLYLADPSVFEVFTHEIAYGDPRRAFDDPHSIAISATMARHYFGDGNPIGKKLDSGAHSYAVTLVFEDLPENTHLRYDALVPMSMLELLSPGTAVNEARDFQVLSVFTYLAVTPEFDPRNFPAMAAKFVDTYLAEAAKRNHERVELRWQPLAEVHFGDKLIADLPVGNILYVYGFGVVAVFILAVGCINYVNLATARALRRAKEVGMRKVLGASRAQLIAQFLGEALAFSAIALVVGFVLVQVAVALTPLASLMGRRELLAELADPVVLLGVLALGVVVGVVAGAYPAFYLSSISPLHALTHVRSSWRTGLSLRQGLVFVQLVISISVIACTLLMIDQMRYVHAKPLGFDKENRLVLTLRGYEIASSMKTLANELRNQPHVRDVLHTLYRTPGTGHGIMLLKVETSDGVFEQTPMHVLHASRNFIEAMDIGIVKGRSFSQDLARDALESVLVNEAFVRKMGWEEPLGKRFDVGGGKMLSVVGVTEDFHYASLHDKVEAFALLPIGDSLGPVPDAWKPFVTTTLIVVLSGENVPRTLAAIESVVRKFDPKFNLDPVFLDDQLDALYETETNLMRLAGVFAGLCVFISVMGIFGLAAFATEQRKKEIGLRKVLGASDSQIVAMMSRPLVWLVVLAALPASYFSYVAFDAWLQRFAYRTDISALTFVAALALVGAVALTTAVVQALRAASSNPADVLRYE